MKETEKHAKAAIHLAFENNFYLPIVAHYRFYKQFLDPYLEQYPEDFQKHFHIVASQYDENFSAFLSSIDEGNIFAKLTVEDYACTQGVLMGFSNTEIAKKLGISRQTVKRRLSIVYEKLGITTRKELIDYIRNYM